jgi:hypothetical protein
MQVEAAQVQSAPAQEQEPMHKPEKLTTIKEKG